MARFRPRRRSSSPVSTRRQSRLRRFRQLFPRFSPLTRLRGMDVLGFFGGVRRRKRLNTTYGLPSLGRRFSLVEALEPRQMLAADVQFDMSTYGADENQTVDYPVVVVNGTTTGGTISFNTSGSANTPGDYTLLGSITLPGGTYNNLQITLDGSDPDGAGPITGGATLTINDDSEVEGDEFINIDIVTAGNLTVGLQNSADYIIGDDDTTVIIDEPDFVSTFDGTRNRVSVEVSGGQLIVRNANNNTIIETHDASQVTNIVATGQNGGDDTLIIDNSVLAAGIHVDYDGRAFGSAALGDSLEIDVDGATNVVYNFANFANDVDTDFAGTITVDGTTVTFVDLEPIIQTGTATNVRFDLTSGADEALLEDVGGGNLRLSSTNGLFEEVTFAAPSNVIDIRSLGGNDIVTLDNSVFDASTRSFHGRVEVRTGGGANDEIRLDIAGGSTQGIDLEFFGNQSDKLIVPDGSGHHDVLHIDGGSIVGLHSLTIDDTADANDDPTIRVTGTGTSLRLDGVTILSDDDAADSDAPVMIEIGDAFSEPDVDLAGDGTNSGTNTFHFTNVPNNASDQVIFVRNHVGSPVLGTDLEENNLIVTANEDEPITIGLKSDGRSIQSASAANGHITFNNGTVTYQTDVNFEGATDTLSFSLSSGGDVNDNPNAAGQVTINIVPQNDAPVNSLPGSFTMNEDGGPLVLSSLVLGVTDADANTDDIKVTLSVTAGTLTVNNAAAPGVVVDNNGSSSVMLTGTVAEINAVLQDIDNDPSNPDPIGLIYNPPANFNGTVTLTMVSDDLGHNPGPAKTDTDTATITVNPVNDAPVNHLDGSPIGTGVTIAGFTEDAADQSISSMAGGPLSVVDDASEINGTITVTLNVANGTLEVDADADNNSPLNNTTSVSGQGSSTLTLSGRIADVNAVLATVTWSPAANFNGNAKLTMTTNDQGNHGSGGSKTDTDEVTLNVGGVNDAPVNQWNGQSFQSLSDTTPNVQVNEDATLAFSSAASRRITISDPDAGSNPIQVTLSVGNGTLAATAQGGASISGSGSSMVITGSQADVNATLGTLEYTPSLNFSGSDTLSIQTNDQGHSGTGGSKTDSDAVEITVNAVNDAPVVRVGTKTQNPDTQSVDEDGMLFFNDGNGNRVRVTDVDGNQFEVTLSVTNGVLHLGSTSGVTIIGGADGSSSIVFTGTQGQVNTALDNLKFSPASNYFGMAQLTISANDLGNTGSGGPQTTTRLVDIAVNPVNDAPVNLYDGIPFENLTDPDPDIDPNETTDENTQVVFSSANGNQLSTSDVDANAGSTDMMVTVSLHHPDAGTLSFGSTSGLDSMTLTNNAATISAKGTLAEINNALEGLTFTPNPTFMGGNYTTTLTLTVNDQGNFGSGGAKSDSDSLQIAVTEINDPPSFDLDGTVVVMEDSGAHNIPGFLENLSAGPGESSQTVTVSVSTSNAGLFASQPALSGSGTTRDLAFALAPDAFGTAVVTVTATDDGSPNLSTSEQFLIIVTAKNDVPVITLPSSPTIMEDMAVTFKANPGSGELPAIVIDDDSGDAASPQDIQARLSVQFGTLNLASTTGLTVSGQGTSTLLITGTQPEIQAALDAGLTYTPNQHHNSSRDTDPSGDGDRLRVQVDDFGHEGGPDFNTGSNPWDADATLNITITPKNDPVFLDNPFPDLSRTEGAPSDVIDLGTDLILGSNFFDDADKNDVPPDNITISVSSSDTSLVTATLSGSDLVLDYQDNQFGSATITVTATDSGGATATDTFVVSVGFVNDPPTISHPDQIPSDGNDSTTRDLGNDDVTNEDTPLTFSSSGGNAITVADPDNTNLTVTLEVQHGTLDLDNPAGSLAVVGDGTASITISGPWADINAALDGMVYTPDANFNGVDPLVITATDGLPQTSSLTVEINVDAVNDPPVAVADSFTVAEDSSGNQLQVRLNDLAGPPDEQATQTIKIVGLSDANGSLSGFQTTQGGTISIGPTPAVGEYVIYTPAPNFYGTDSFQYIIEDNLGATSVLGTVTINVTPVNDAPIVTSSSSATTAEDTPLALGSGALNIEVRDDSPTGQSASSSSQVVVNLTALNGTFDIDAQGGVSVGSTAGGVTLIGSVADINATLDASDYVPNQHFNTTNLGDETITVTVEDQGNIGGGASLSDSTTIDVTVNSVNDAPVLTFNPNPVQVNQNSGSHTFSGFIANRSPGGGADEAGQTVTITGFSEQSDPNNVVSGVAIDNANGQLTFTVNAGVVGTAVIQVSSQDSGGPSGEPAATNTQTFEIRVGVNKEPIFTLVGNHPSPMNPGDVLVDEDTDLNVITGWLQDLFAGPADDFPTNQSIQSISINVLSGASLFTPSGQPGLTNLVLPAPGEDPPGGGGSGDLVFTLQDDVTGTATLRITIVDNGGTANGGDNSRSADFKIEIQGVNDPPSFSLPSTVHNSNEDQGPVVVNNFATNISPGTGESGQTVSFTVTPQSGNPAGLFSSAPSITSGGTLLYQAAPDANGIAFFSVVATDSEGASSSPQTFAIVVGAVNDAPTASFTPDPVVVDEGSGAHVVAGHTVVSPGPANESGQTVTVAVVGNSNTSLFSSQPMLVSAGGNTYDLEFEAAAGASGTATITVQLTDDGGTSNGGDNSATVTFEIVVNSVSDGEVVGRRVFYKDSSHDSSKGTLNALDDAAIDPSKTALLPGQQAAFENTTGFWKGINGIMIDVQNLANPDPAALADDLSFRTGNSDNTSTWTSLSSSVLDTSQGTGGIAVRQIGPDLHRITVAFDDNAIRNTWLEVRLAASSDTGLAAEEVHYWGNVAGNAENQGDANRFDADAFDMQVMAGNFGANVLIDNPYDVDKDRVVGGLDMQIVASQNFGVSIPKITPNGASAAPAASGVAIDTSIDDGSSLDGALGGDTFSGGNTAVEDGRVGDTSSDDSVDDAFASFGEDGSMDDDLLDLLAGGMEDDLLS